MKALCLAVVTLFATAILGADAEARVIDATRGYEKAAVPKTIGGEAVWFVRYRP